MTILHGRKFWVVKELMFPVLLLLLSYELFEMNLINPSIDCLEDFPTELILGVAIARRRGVGL